MNITLDLPDPFSDPRDDFRKGFVAAVTHLRGQSRPTQLQLRAALEVLGEYRLLGTVPAQAHPIDLRRVSSTASSQAPRRVC
jgi:hypothetical protein